MNDQTNTDVVQQTYEAVGRGDIPAVLALLTDDVEWTLQHPVCRHTPRTRWCCGVLRIGRGNLEFEVFEPHAFVAHGDTVIALGHERSRSTSTGHPVVQEWAHVYSLRNGKVARFQAFEDTATLEAAFDAG